MNKVKYIKECWLYKLIWIFLICSFVGAIIEIIWCYFAMHRFMSRSSLLYGQFSVIWGFAAVLLTISLYKIKNKSCLYIFGVGTILGGVYEYICSFLIETFFGIKFWDYSQIPFNINGRINLLFCLFWGIIAVLWIKKVYPFLSNKIENVPIKLAQRLTCICVVFLIFDMSLSAGALIRGYQRQQDIPAQTSIAKFLDERYSDEVLMKRYPNMLK